MHAIEPLPFSEALPRAQRVVQTCLDAMLPERGDNLTSAMRYAVVGGKALRGFLVLEGARLHNVQIGPASMAALAIECVHAYSLIHDDLPCMDDDDLRRGQPTVHRKWDEAVAVLAGDALQAMAFELLAHGDIGRAEVSRDLGYALAVAAGRVGMVGGQMLDIEAESRVSGHTLDQIEAVQNGKTGALIRWSAMAGAMLAQAETHALETYGDKLGLAFQIADDVLDVEGDAATVGKAVGKDADAGKATFVSLMGLDGAKRRAKDLVDEACDALSVYGEAADTLREAARFVIARSH
ncbi:polyprenyl synthetase family protein [Pseudooctadecabacter sp.]|uniref:polyprenyl synthetase family protein n=1 Tax=Pseudooctadecabacter sp. TaxID=1966338 RepID=UPI0035C870F6